MKEARPIKPWRSSARVSKTVDEAEKRLSNQSDIDQLSGAHCLQVNQAEYTLIRDFILTQITVANAQRSGVLINMTTGEFNKSKAK